MRSSNMVSFKSLSCAMSAVLFTGILVKRATSKETKTVLCGLVWFQINSQKSNELVTCELVFPTSGDNKVTKCLDRKYVGELMSKTMGLNGSVSL